MNMKTLFAASVLLLLVTASAWAIEVTYTLPTPGVV
jgi:hypothetical protein